MYTHTYCFNRALTHNKINLKQSQAQFQERRGDQAVPFGRLSQGLLNRLLYIILVE